MIEDLEFLNLHPSLKMELERYLHNIPEDQYASPNTIGIYDVLKAHYLIADHFIAAGEGISQAGPRDIELLHSALFRQFSGYGNFNKYTTIFDKAATTLFGIVKDHPFHDANKRTALLSTVHFLYKNGFTPCVNHKVIEDFVVDVADSRLKKYQQYKTLIKKGERDPEIVIISRKLKSYSRKIDKNQYTITYRELNNILNKHRCRIGDPSGNYINVYKTFGKGNGGKIKYTSWKGKPSLGCTHGARKSKYRRRNKLKVATWDSEFEWKLLLEHDYSHFFDASCNRYDYYLGTVLDGLEVIKVGEDASSHPTIDIPGGYTALEDDLFVPNGYYTNKRDGIPVIFDSGCTHAVAPVEFNLWEK